MHAPEDADDWVGLTTETLPVALVAEWVVTAHCGAAVTFNGTARDHSDGRPGVHTLEYEAYVEHVEARLAALATEARIRWFDLGRIAMIHRMGPVEIGQSAVVVAVSAPHRDAAFDAARFCIDTLKATVPIWKREGWDGGESWGLEPQHVRGVSDVDTGIAAAEHRS